MEGSDERVKHIDPSMARFEIVKLEFSKSAVRAWEFREQKHHNWPVVYLLDNKRKSSPGNSNQLNDVYVGESLNAVGRFLQHLEAPSKQHLRNAHIIFNESFNKSVCLDLESQVIKLLAGDGIYRVLNLNSGLADFNYYRREEYREGFREIFEQLAETGVFTRSIAEIENSDLFKLSPFKTLTQDQADSVEQIINGVLNGFEGTGKGCVVVEGHPGTGKTVVAIYLIKLLIDIKNAGSINDTDDVSRFSCFFVAKNKNLLQNFRIGLVVPQQSLRDTIRKVFKKTPGLQDSMVITPFDVGQANEPFDLLLVDETHRLNRRASQASGVLNAKFAAITRQLFGDDDISKTQLDWILAKSRHQVFLLDAVQTVRPADLPQETLLALIDRARSENRLFQLQTQMRVRAGPDYVAYVRHMLDPHSNSISNVRQQFEGYDFRMFNSFEDMHNEVFRRDSEVGVSRIVAGYAWEWKTRKDKNAYDIEIGQMKLRWNSTATDWIASSGSLEEVGSIHTVQGYDLNYVGVIIGLDLRFSHSEQRMFASRSHYFDKKGKENNPVLGISFSDQDLLRFITQIYAVLMTRGMLGTYVYVCDPSLREHLKRFIPFYT